MNMDKRGQALSMQTIIIIILAVIVLVFIVIHFTGGIQRLWGGAWAEYSQVKINAKKLECQNKGIESFCTMPVQLYNEKTEQLDDIMCYKSPINAAIKVNNETINSKADCEAHNYFLEE